MTKNQEIKKILVTGGAGFIGSHLIETILKKTSSRIVCIDNFDDAYDPRLKQRNIEPFLKNLRFILYKNDIRDLTKMKQIFKKEKPDAIVHLAAKADTRKAVLSPFEYISVNIEGTLNLLECSREFGIKKFVFASSSSVYGNKNSAPFSEEDQTDFPLSPYGASKKAAEILIYTYHHNFNLPAICLRVFNAYGERMRPNLVLPLWLKKMLNGEPIEMSGDGTRRRDFTYVGDTVNAIMLALKKPFDFEIINIGNSRPLTLNQLLHVLEKAAGITATVYKRPSHHASVEQTHASTKKAKHLLGWKPLMPIEKGVKRFVSWARNGGLEDIHKR
ncbi:MAG: GDP-mannose 4,6-dehydratase [Candidatus Terrybacteria bacterium]|nr:GDP-mannose 4,6-dehydratase [Candidatus Terrybacteria bacterium]